jgi:hypothetical protein
MPLILTTPTNPGTATWTDAGDLLTASTFVLDVSAATETANVYNNLDSLAAAVASVAGPKIVQVAIPAALVALPGGATGFVIPNGTQGPYAFGECAFVTVLGAAATLPISIDFADGVVFSGMPYRFAGQGVSWRFPAGFWTPTATFNVINVDGPILFSKPGLVASGCFIVGDNIYVTVYTGSLGAVSGWGDAPATEGLFEISTLGFVQVSLYDQGQVGKKTASGPGYLQVIMGDANCTCDLQTLLTGTLDIASNEHGTIVYDTTFTSAYNFIYPSWAVVYSIARNSGLNRDQIVHVNGVDGTIPSGTWDLSNIILTGDPGSILTIANGADLSATTQLRVAGHLTVRIDAGVATSPFVWPNGTRTVQISDSAVIENLSSVIPPVPVITASGATALRLTGAGSRYVPAATGGAFLSAGGTVVTDIALTRAVQAPILLTTGTVGLSETAELQQKGTSAAAPGTVFLTDGSGNGYVQIPKYSTVLLQGTITARGVTAGTANAGSWTFATMVTRDNVGSTITSGATATAVSAANYPTAPVWVLDAGSGGVKLQCTGSNAGASSQWTANITVNGVGTGA